MPFNGAGSFTRPVSDYVFDTVISETDMNTEMAGIATGLSTCMLKDGTQTLTANIPFGGFKITGYGSSSTPNAHTDVPSMGQVQDGKINWVDGGGTADAITATYSPAITTLVDGQLCFVRATAANATTTPTFAPNGLTARTIVKTGGQALVAGDIAGDGHELILRYDLTNTRWELLNPATADVPNNSITGAKIAMGSDAQGDILYYNGTDYARLAAGTSGQFLKTQGAGANPVWANGITSDTEQATTSGTAKDFTSIPAGTKRITIQFIGVSTNGTSIPMIQIGDSGGLEPTGYSGCTNITSSGGTVSSNHSSGFHLSGQHAAADVIHGMAVLTLEDSSDNTWAFTCLLGHSDEGNVAYGGGTKSLSGTLDRLRFTMVNGTDAFDAGAVNIMYE
jgi:hypothetical protein